MTTPTRAHREAAFLASFGCKPYDAFSGENATRTYQHWIETGVLRDEEAGTGASAELNRIAQALADAEARGERCGLERAHARAVEIVGDLERRIDGYEAPFEIAHDELLALIAREGE